MAGCETVEFFLEVCERGVVGSVGPTLLVAVQLLLVVPAVQVSLLVVELVVQLSVLCHP